MAGRIACLLLLLSPLLSAGQATYNLPPEKFYEKATIGFPNFDKKEVTRLSITADSLTFLWKGQRYGMQMNDISYIRVREGSKAGGGALIGGGSMLIISLASIASVQNDPNYKLKDNAGETVVLLTLGGAALGALIGASVSNNRSYYVHVSPVKKN